MNATQEQALCNVQVRRHNGQCAYGEWVDVFEDDLPAWLAPLVADEVSENYSKHGRVEQGGSIWLWRKS